MNSTRQQWKKVALIATIAILAPLWYNPAALAQNVLAGVDLWETPADGTTYVDIGGGAECPPIPIDFFDPGSDPFDGIINFQGQPLQTIPAGMLGTTDTIVERLEDAVLPECPSTSTVDIQIVALNLVSTAPITVTYNGGQNPEDWDVQMCLSSMVAPQDVGSMEINQACEEGGTFSAYIPVTPKFIFTRVDLPSQRIWDYGSEGVGSITYYTEGHWLYDDHGFNVTTSPGGVLVDHDCDGVSNAAVGASSNFYPGLQAVPCDCQSEPIDYNMVLTLWQSEFCGSHGVYPPQSEEPTIFPVIETECPELETWCPEAETQCPAVETQCPVVETKCPVIDTECPAAVQTECPIITTECPVVETNCPVDQTYCPAIETQCPSWPTWCPEEETLCPKIYTYCPIEEFTICPEYPTWCPAEPFTVCPEYQTLCPDYPTECSQEPTWCPPMETWCPVYPEFTYCPINETECPASYTFCPMDWTYCPEIPTVCPELDTVCPVIATECPVGLPTECPIDPTNCPVIPTACGQVVTLCDQSFTDCPVDTQCPYEETACPDDPTWCPENLTYCPLLDSDGDGLIDCYDNCPIHPNSSLLGTCVKTQAGMVVSYRVGDPKDFITCTGDGACTATGGTCDMAQGNCNATACGDVCECLMDCNNLGAGDGKVTGSDLGVLKNEYGRFNCTPSNPCYSDGNEDGKVTGSDLGLLKNEYGRFDCPVCP